MLSYKDATEEQRNAYYEKRKAYKQRKAEWLYKWIDRCFLLDDINILLKCNISMKDFEIQDIHPTFDEKGLVCTVPLSTSMIGVFRYALKEIKVQVRIRCYAEEEASDTYDLSTKDMSMTWDYDGKWTNVNGEVNFLYTHGDNGTNGCEVLKIRTKNNRIIIQDASGNTLSETY